MNVVKNDNGYIVDLTLMDGEAALDLTAATITAVFKNADGIRTEKFAAVTVPLEGKCRTSIDAAETVAEGVLEMQIQVRIMDARYSSDIEQIAVTDSL